MQTSDSDTSGNAPLLLHISAAADYLGLSRYQVRLFIKDGTLPTKPVGKRTYIPVEALEQFAGRAS